MTYWRNCCLCFGTGRYQYVYCKMCGGRGGEWITTARKSDMKG